LSADFYSAHAAGFDASRGHQPWPGWERLLAWLPERGDAPLRVLDVGCGNARLATFLASKGHALRYVGVDANAELLAAARDRIDDSLQASVELVELDFLSGDAPGRDLPNGPFDLVALFGVLHHVPGRDWRAQLVDALIDRVESGGVLALAAWQFAGRERFARRQVDWSEIGPVLDHPIDPAKLEQGDALLRFGSDPSKPPRYCHQVTQAELDSIVMRRTRVAVEIEDLDSYLADGAEGDLNRYRLLRRCPKRDTR
jgi:SAM-dependent methyltransferase